MTPRRTISIAFKRKLYLVGAVCFFILGVLGLFLPILQGVLFLLVSLVLFAKGSARGRILRRKFIKRFPRLGVKVVVAEAWLRSQPHRVKLWFRR